MMKTSFTFGLIACAIGALALPALAEEAPMAAAPAPAQDQVIDAAELADLSGGDGVTVNMFTAQTLSAVNSGNTVQAGGDINSGQINLNAAAFDGFSGIGNFVMNTGANNNLQSTLAVNIVLAP